MLWTFNSLLAKALLGRPCLQTPYGTCQALCWRAAEYPTPKIRLFDIRIIELKSLEKQYVQERNFELPFTYWKQEIKIPCEKMVSLYQEERDVVITRNRVKAKRNLYK